MKHAQQAEEFEKYLCHKYFVNFSLKIMKYVGIFIALYYLIKDIHN
jgi:hypothetical protein